MRTFPLLLLLSVWLSSAPFVSAARVRVYWPSNDPGAEMAVQDANFLVSKHDFNGAIRLYTAALKRDPRLMLAYYWRGQVYVLLHQYERALADFNSALKIEPAFMQAGTTRANTYCLMKRYDQALAELHHLLAVEMGPDSRAQSLNELAWLRATCPNRAYRNGQFALDDAKRACRLDQWENGTYLETLAAAYAETGDFANAQKFEQKAIAKMDDPGDVARGQKRLVLFQNRQAIANGYAE